ncbi:DUF550 domain-containing protein [Salmonella enterica]|uniref:DUF550 domain-containing protein n=3 Tax=Salmonella enterica I TaxID=59201 RepID=A0A5V6DI86_SALET|nr:DUF550 domain-containing protein [Salmonella enterica]EBH9883071.1 DUF550 domain-containing protein [Salmonella enterica subsp. enterica serovar Kisarawe]EBQ9204077.1 DUF550 domain-containing protein [Salmonella enterica subsp. enterica serovar Anecho]EBS5144623.1 DUF550 domain-containing protein [Salmonella enterica subsp. enterica serovar Cotham]EBU7233490.1 DUF550 domain-containing protein [Salmonella enterica subsp. enterica serovar Tennessee]EBV5831002.1 DUF550 domain-containing protei
MTTITKEFTKEQLIAKAREQIAFCRDTKITGEGCTHVNQCSSLFEIALAALTAEPVAWTDAEELRDLRTVGFCEMFTVEPVSKDADMYRVIPLYTDSPVPERERIRREHAEWSDATFGGVGPVGPLKHLSKEALEAAAEPDDLSEWADMQFLLWDAQRRAGISDGKITAAMVDKLKVNKQREWPEPKDGEPRLHIKEQPAPVVPEEMPKGLAGQIVSLLAHNIGDKFLAQKIWNACRAAMLQANQRDLSQPVGPQVAEYEQIMLQAGWVMVPVEPTDEMIAAAMECEDVLFNSDGSFCVQFREIYCAMVDAVPKPEVNSESN